MTTSPPVLDQTPRITALPGPGNLVRISEPAWRWLQLASTQGPDTPELPPPPEEQAQELELAGILGEDPEDADSLVVDRRWTEVIAGALGSPVGVELVCTDGPQAWTTSLRVAGRVVLVIDQVRELQADQTTLSLERRSTAVTLAVTTIENFSATLEAFVPQRPAFTDAEPAPAPEVLPDAPAVAEVQMLVISSPTPETTIAGGGSFYAYGEDGKQLAVLQGAPEGPQAREVAPGALSATARADLLAAIHHATGSAAAQNRGA